MELFRKYHIPAIVFITGACVLVVEVVATRILSPYFGNTIFTVSSVIGVVLGALSLGYYYGGKFADRFPHKSLFYAIIALGGISVMALYVLMRVLLPLLGYTYSIVAGPLVASIILFIPPAFVLGMLSPFAIKLYADMFPQKGIGNVAGEIFFWSTLGSIVGSLSAGFLLIPHMGVSAIILSVGVILIALGAFPLIRMGIYKRTLLQAIFWTVLVTGMCWYFLGSYDAKGLVYAKDGVYTYIRIFDGEYKGKPARFLIQDQMVSAIMFLDSDELAADYTRYFYVHELFSPKVDHVLAIGAGAYSVPKSVIEKYPNAEVDVVDIEPDLYALGQKYFRVEENPRMHNYIEDGRRFLERSTTTYDVIFADAYHSRFSVPAHLTTKEFLEHAKDRLTPDGAFVVNVIGNLSSSGRSFAMAELNTMRAVFPRVYAFAVESTEKKEDQNLIFVGYKGDKRDALVLKGDALDPMREYLAERVVDIDTLDFTQYKVFTDDFAPVEYYARG